MRMKTSERFRISKNKTNRKISDIKNHNKQKKNRLQRFSTYTELRKSQNDEKIGIHDAVMMYSNKVNSIRTGRANGCFGGGEMKLRTE